MTQAMVAIFAAALLAMVGAFFGVCIARLVWADDLKHAKELRKINDRIIATQQKHINLLRERLGEAPL
jgi:hypothetical protein